MTDTREVVSASESTEPLWLRIIDRLTLWGGGLTGILILLMTVNIIIDVVGRSLFNHPLPGTLELVTNLWMPGISMLALGLAQIRNEQIRVTLLNENTRSRTQRVLEIVSELIAVVLLAWMSYLEVLAMLKSFQIAEKTSGIIPILLWPGHLMIAVGLAVAVLAALARIARLVQGATIQLGDVVDDEGVFVE